MVVKPRSMRFSGQMVEAMPDWVATSRYSKRFKYIQNHGRFSGEIDERMLLVLCSGSFSVNLVDEMRIEIPHNFNHFECSTWDMAATICSTRWTRYEALKLVGVFKDGAEKKLGYWLRKKKSFILCDLTHTLRGKVILDQVMKKCRMHVIKNLYCTDKISVTLGADPEYELWNKSSTDLLDASCEGFDSVSASVGCDGCSNTLELRQPPASTPEEAVENLRGLFGSIAELPYNVSARGDRLPLGCHIHIGVGKQEHNPEDLIHVLDALIGKPTLGLSGQARGSYKRLSMWRSQPHGFEYRTPPSAVTANPELYRLVMKMAKNASEKFYALEGNAYLAEDDSKFSAWGGLTEEEIDRYRAIIGSLENNSSGDVIAAWVDRLVPAPKLSLSFSHEWDAPMEASVIEALRDVKVTGDYSLHLFGLMQSRGYVFSGIPVDSVFPEFPYKNEKAMFVDHASTGVGVPYCFRKAGNFSTTLQQRIDMVDALRDAIIKRLKMEGVICA